MSTCRNPPLVAGCTNDHHSQLLELLLDLNSSLKIPSTFRYSLGDYPLDPPLPPIEPQEASDLVHQRYQQVKVGQYPQPAFLVDKETLEEQVARQDARNLIELESNVPHARYDPDRDNIPEHLTDIAADPQPGYLTSRHEDEYLLRMDAKLGDQYSLAQPRPVSPPVLSSLTPRELEREIELKNPQSVHNWLRKHNPTVAADADGASEAGAPATGGKRRNLAKKVGDRAVERAREREEGSPMSVAKMEAEGADEDVAFGVDETPGSGRSKRSRDADETYRPKGGRSGKGKRKREDGEAVGKGKKARTSMASVLNEG